MAARLFFSRSLLLAVGVSVAATAAGALFHEWFHVLAGRRLGLPSRLRIGSRLYYLVLETTLIGLMSVPPRRRILPMCAGLIADSLVISAATGLAEAGRLAGWPPAVAGVAGAVAYATLLRMLWQCMIFLETDLYHVAATALRCPGLHAMTRAYLRGRAARLLCRPAAEPAGWAERDRRIVRWYAPVVLAGGTVLVALTVVAAGPAVSGIAVRLYQGLADSGPGHARFWNSAVLAAGLAGEIAVLIAVRVRDFRQARRPGAPIVRRLTGRRPSLTKGGEP